MKDKKDFAKKVLKKSLCKKMLEKYSLEDFVLASLGVLPEAETDEIIAYAETVFKDYSTDNSKIDLASDEDELKSKWKEVVVNQGFENNIFALGHVDIDEKKDKAILDKIKEHETKKK